MKFIELKDKEIEELKKMLVEKKSELFELKLKLKTMQLNNPGQIAAVRKDIARINTAISAKKD
ncbi:MULTISPECIES: 50S ribosomal protein L29 [unclassified Helicobacter]|uniref:50S ribosomal protein L29 n=1 Tax=unclassified Helicobacter TaxID=2593540 RepID=UPI000BA67567|nr:MULTISPECIES: 50S ribosomal protein L29 [unclassified Helicobacter]PAF43996.1 50S ribosomal protein L29 [Helicobacter sp. 11S02596-1]PAF48289.1 50S ribosomal protein L29 [Helicobacter sp. 12S02232-10]